MADVEALQYYRGLPYTRTVERALTRGGRPGYEARIEEMPFIHSHGGTARDALQGLEEAFDRYVGVLLEQGAAIPEPVPPSRALPRMG